MKNVLIVGKTSYIGCAFQRWMADKASDWNIEAVSSRDGAWKNVDYGKYDCILHLAGIAHVNAKNDMEQEYYKVNRDLAVDSCKKAKEDGCKQFVFMSSIIVYGESTSLKPFMIDKNTKPCPNGFYGNSKLQAEEEIKKMSDADFSVAIVRPPMVYGKNSKGNYRKLAKMAGTFPVFPNMKNQRSMIHIDNLCEFLRLLIENEDKGIFCPQNKQYVNTTDLVCEIANVKGKRILTTKIFNPILYCMSKKVKLINKVFGSLCYETSMSDYYDWKYCVCDFKESVERTER
ncbi:MAG: NAD-dependent epimerase/dehydratase family protein [Lachnospiraceae bacterium]|nr:NAD-dependent epimerase/dehydratase family protein [Lachnospiraceae bacterium]